jgi:hypothetical protein
VIVWKKSRIDERHPGGCWNIRGCWRSSPNESTWPRSSRGYGTGQTELTAYKKFLKRKRATHQRTSDSTCIQHILTSASFHRGLCLSVIWPLLRYCLFVALGRRWVICFSISRKRTISGFCSFCLTDSILSLSFHYTNFPLHNQRVLSFNHQAIETTIYQYYK